MTKMMLTDADKALICSALRIAADQFEKDAATCATEHVGRLVQQFEAQVTQARELSDKIEDSDYVEVVTVTVGSLIFDDDHSAADEIVS